MKKYKHDSVLCVNLSPEEKLEVQQHATKLGLSQSSTGRLLIKSGLKSLKQNGTFNHVKSNR